jgi:S-adenosylmethionine:tRNA ribosyltransferase-isomerase
MNRGGLSRSSMQYDLPPELIAQKPLSDRSSSRLLAVDIKNGTITDTSFSRISDFLHPGDLLVLNNTRVFKARLTGRKASTGGKAELFLLKDLGDYTWKALLRPGKASKAGTKLEFGSGIKCTVEKRLTHGRAIIRFEAFRDFEMNLAKIARVPLPPYIKRDPDELDDIRYQTVYASETGAVAAPTAGLHFTKEILASLREKGIDNVHVTLHVGPGTFQPLRHEKLKENSLDPEEYHISLESISKIRETRLSGGRVVAVGTTTTRVLESIDIESMESLSGETEIFIFPPYKFRNVDALITNFHLPGSSLLCLVAAFMGYEFMVEAYRHAIDESYRFYSYGDAMLIEQELRK